jgi:hypothetical protein
VAGRPRVIEVADGDAYALRIAPVAKRLGDTTVRMLADNGSIPGPTLMGRFGNVLVVGGEPDLHLEARAGRWCGCG